METHPLPDEIMEECITTEDDFMDDWVQYTFETYGSQSPEYKATMKRGGE